VQPLSDLLGDGRRPWARRILLPSGKHLKEGLALGPDMKPSKARAGTEAAIALCAGALGILTIFWHDWIEALTGWDPDHHNGTFEWLIVAALIFVAAVLGAIAHRDWRLATAATDSIPLYSRTE
jgi:hypothetical protein